MTNYLFYINYNNCFKRNLYKVHSECMLILLESLIILIENINRSWKNKLALDILYYLYIFKNS